MSADTGQLTDGHRDIERATAELAERLPAPLAPLASIAFNYRWSWYPNGAGIFREIDPTAWRRGLCNPRQVIEAVPPRRLQELTREADYLSQVRAVSEDLAADLRRPALAGAITPERPVAYFCSEFGIHCSLPIYSGGLGILAGDMLKAASDMALPMVGVGLFYRYGYFHQRLDQSGWQHEYWTTSYPDRLPAVLVTDADQRPLTVQVVVGDRTVTVQIWRINVGRVPLYLLDTDRDDNHPIDRWITARLYVGDRHTRLAQYAVLGIGGARALNALGITPALIHLNEGHAALGGFERMRQALQAGHPLGTAMDLVRQHTVFTTHTPVPAGNEGYYPGEIEQVLSDFIDRLGIPRMTFYDLGRVTPGNADEPANITPLALHTSRTANGVSRRHGAVARAMWQPLWPNVPEADVPIGHVTNGVHTFTWMSHVMQSLLDRHFGPAWREHLSDEALWARIDAIPDAELWQARCTMRGHLVEFARERSMEDRLARGETHDYVEQAARMFDPKVLTIGFARRVATYKRLYLLTRQIDRGLRLLNDPTRPIQLVVAGKAHPADNEAKHALHNFFQLKHGPLVAARVVFLEDYDMHLAPRMVAGVDLWLNLPRPPLEASGTSGMKVVLNGGMNLSVLDGWWAEAYDPQCGWGIESPEADPDTQDHHDASVMFDLLEREVIPLFYDQNAAGVPHGWVQRVKASMKALIPRFTAERMLRDYVHTMYAPR